MFGHRENVIRSYFSHALGLLLFFASLSHAASIRNMQVYEEEGGRVRVCYDLVSNGTMNIRLIGKADNFDLDIDKVSGDVGKMVLPGDNKCILWDTMADYPDGLSQYDVVLDIEYSEYQPAPEPTKNPADEAAMKACEAEALYDGSLFTATRSRIDKAEAQLRKCTGALFVSGDSCSEKNVAKLAEEARKQRKDLADRVKEYCQIKVRQGK